MVRYKLRKGKKYENGSLKITIDETQNKKGSNIKKGILRASPAGTKNKKDGKDKKESLDSQIKNFSSGPPKKFVESDAYDSSKQAFI